MKRSSQSPKFRATSIRLLILGIAVASGCTGSSSTSSVCNAQVVVENTGLERPVNAFTAGSGGSSGAMAQQFVATQTVAVKDIQIKLKQTGSLIGSHLALSVYSDNGTGAFPSAALVTSTLTLTSTTISTTVASWITFTLPCYYTLISGTTYWLVLQSDYPRTSGDPNVVSWLAATNSSATGLSFQNVSNSWTQSTDRDQLFYFDCKLSTDTSGVDCT